jgi:predicted Zn finger-like uncharacterized protein
MSLVTRCPACSTAFKVVRDQLRISEGWVRCGRCSQVFDATLDLRDSEDGEPKATDAPAGPASPPAPEASAAAHGSAASDPDEEVGTAPSLDEDDFVEPDDPSLADAPATAWPARELLDLGHGALPARAPSELGGTEVADSLLGNSTLEFPVPTAATGWSKPLPVDLPVIVADEPWPLGAAHRSSGNAAASGESMPSPVDEAVNAQLQKALRRARIQALRESRARARAEANGEAHATTAAAPAGDAEAPAAPSAPATDPVASLHEAATLRQASEEPPAPEAAAPPPALPSFLDVGQAPAEAKKSPPHRAAWLTFAVLATLVLVLQVLRHERDALAATQPGMRSVLAALCQLSGCELSPARRIDAIRIDGSSFTPEREGGGYRLLFSLRNASPTALAMPAIELSLLDGNERPVVRRVFQPAEFGAPGVLGPRAEHAATLALALKLPESGGVPPVVGYSLLAFYP